MVLINCEDQILSNVLGAAFVCLFDIDVEHIVHVLLI